MKLIVKYFDTEVKQFEIYLTKKEAEIAKQLLLGGVEFLSIGEQLINTKYIIGIFEGGQDENYIGPERQIEAYKQREQNMENIKKELQKVRKALEEKGILQKKK